MKKILLLAILFSIEGIAFGQIDKPREITPEILQKIKASIEKQIPAFKQKLTLQKLTADEIEFSLDTFRIEQMVSKRIDIDYSTAGMKMTVDKATASYDNLMNRYYNKLLKILEPEDKKVLVSAQKAWIAFRGAEFKLIGTMTKEEYSGGGTIQSNLATSSYSDLVEKRAIEIFNYYDAVVNQK